MVKDKFAIRGGTLIDGTGNEPVEDAVVIVEGTRIVDVGSKGEVSIPQGFKEIDASELTIMPGLMDIHIHLTAGRYKPGWSIPIELTWALESNYLKCLRASVDAWKILDQGITTVSDMSKFGIPLRIAIEEGTMFGPRIIPCGMCLTGTGGSSDYRRDRINMTDEFALKINPYAMIVSGEDNAREAVRVLFREGADHIKIVGTGTLTVDEMKAIVDQAHRLGGKVHAHAEDPREVKDVLKLDVDLIIHSRAVFDEEALKKIAERNIFLVPTLALRLIDFESLFPPFENLVDSHQGVTGLPPHKSEEYCKMVDDGVRRAHELGVKIACGSDVWLEPITPFASYSIMEVKFLANALSPMDAIVSATKTSAEALGIGEHVGTIETGKLADIILVKGDPLEDINVLTDKNNIKRIMKEGKTMLRFQEAHKSLRIIKPKTKHF